MKEFQIKLETDTEDRGLHKIFKLMEAYNKSEIEFTLDFCELEDVIKYYINRELDINLDDLDILIDITSHDDNVQIEFDVNEIENEIELDFIKKEFKRHFGSNILKCDIKKVLRMIFIDCCAYKIYNDYITISFDANNLQDNWLFKYFKDN